MLARTSKLPSCNPDFHPVHLQLKLKMPLNFSIRIFRALITVGAKFRSFSTVPIEDVDAVVVGAGVVGIAVARELAMKHGREVIVIESAPTFGTGSSSRNSEVIHGGIYYPRDSLKARFCVRGRHLLYEYCRQRDIPHKQIGKLIVATRLSELTNLNLLMTRGTENGVEGLRMMEGHEATLLEPELQCTKALLSPASGIIDSHSFMLYLVGEAENHGAIFSYSSTVIGGQFKQGLIQLHVSESQALKNWDGKSPVKPDLIVTPRIVVNSAGLGSIALSKQIHGLDNGILPQPYFARGFYFTLSNVKTPPFQHLIYPIPEDGGLGVHVTLDLNGQIRFGPDVEWIDGVDEISSFLNLFDYSVPGDRANQFYPQIRKYYPSLKDGSLEPGYAGIRPKITGPNQTPADFLIQVTACNHGPEKSLSSVRVDKIPFNLQGEEVHGIQGLINLMGIESPGLTSSLAIAEHVASRLSR